MAAPPPDSFDRRAGSPLGGDIAAQIDAIVRAAEREALAAEHAIAERRREAEDEVRRYLAATRLRVDAEAAARAARLEVFGERTRQLADELADAASALRHELDRAEDDVRAALPRQPWPSVPEPQPAPAAETARPEPTPEPEPAAREPEPEPAASPQAPEPTWSRRETGAEVPSAARLVAIEMAVGGSARSEVERHLREQLGVAEPEPLLDDVFGAASHAGSRLAWGEP